MYNFKSILILLDMYFNYFPIIIQWGSVSTDFLADLIHLWTLFHQCYFPGAIL